MNRSSGKSYFIETHGCQMNVADSQIVETVMDSAGYSMADDAEEADVLFINTCAIREGAEQKIWNKLGSKHHAMKLRKREKKIGVLGCMAERLKDKMLENKTVDLVAGPDAYRDLPRLLKILENQSEESEQAMNVQLSFDETYADIIPVRKDKNDFHAWISIMRGCNNMCSFCIVPFTRGRERSRPTLSIEDEVRYLRDQGVREVTLLGQNVNSYHDQGQMSQWLDHSFVGGKHENSSGFKETFKLRDGEGVRFAELLDRVSDIAPEVRFRFTSPHPKDFPDPLLHVIANKANVCKQIHLPAQSGNTDMLFRMRRNHSRESYLELVSHIREIIPGVALSSDFICGFCGETDEEFEDTMSLIELVGYDQAFFFAYSMRERTHAHRRMQDDVPEDVKKRRLVRMIDAFKVKQLEIQKAEIGREHLVFIDKLGRVKETQFSGLTDTNKRAILPRNTEVSYDIGDLVRARVTDSSQNTLFCEPI
uniref:Uncharacterized protein n=1 Tax=Strombidium rassoulzadegani TaxID=1082188 RepID=A0A7S3CTV3_9SPIT|mmetsp:Transcript_8676/g.14716  ORF Transcript_8676/g.14716 Transcript_8676/m.14716 type:complete len:480 (+) Transcript_8676:286-1725(+)